MCVCFQYLHASHTQAAGQSDRYSEWVSPRHPDPSCLMPPRRLREQEHQRFLSSQVIQIFFFSGTRWSMTFTSLVLTNISLCHPQQTVLKDYGSPTTHVWNASCILDFSSPLVSPHLLLRS